MRVAQPDPGEVAERLTNQLAGLDVRAPARAPEGRGAQRRVNALALSVASGLGCLDARKSGEVAERLNALVLKTSIG